MGKRSGVLSFHPCVFVRLLRCAMAKLFAVAALIATATSQASTGGVSSEWVNVNSTAAYDKYEFKTEGGRTVSQTSSSLRGARTSNNATNATRIVYNRTESLAESTCCGDCPCDGTPAVDCANPLAPTCASKCNCWKHSCCR